MWNSQARSKFLYSISPRWFLIKINFLSFIFFQLGNQVQADEWQICRLPRVTEKAATYEKKSNHSFAVCQKTAARVGFTKILPPPVVS